MFHIGQRRTQWRASCAALGCWFASSTATGAPWLTAVDETCGVAPEALERRISDAVAGERDPDLRVEVWLHEGSRDGAEPGATALVRLRKADRDLGSRRVEAPDCAEAIDALVAVVALALSSAREPSSDQATPQDDGVGQGSMPSERASRGASQLDASRTDDEGAVVGPAPLDTDDASADLVLDSGEDRDAARSSAEGWHALAAAGLDKLRGRATAVLGAGAALHAGTSAWRAQVWYGARSTEEETDGVESSKTDSDFAAATLDYCRRLDGWGWFGLCGGVELSLGRRWRSEQDENAARREREALYPGASAMLGAVFAYPGARLEPRLDVSARWPVLGGPAEGAGLGIRATGGVALSFW